MTDIPALARSVVERMTEAQRIDLLTQIYEIHLRAMQPIDYTQQQCVPVPDWMLQQCQQARDILPTIQPQ